MWLCPICKFYMKSDERECIQCKNQLKFFENVLKIPLESLFVKIKLSEYNDILNKQAKIKKEKNDSKVYWMCPKGCSDLKIDFSEKCRGC